MGAIVGVGNSTSHGTISTRPSLDILGSPSIRRQSRHAAKLNMGDTKDDIHVCIMCLRAIMNNKVRSFRGCNNFFQPYYYLEKVSGIFGKVERIGDIASIRSNTCKLEEA